MRFNRRSHDTEDHDVLLVDWKLVSLHCASRTVIRYTVDRMKAIRGKALDEAHTHTAEWRDETFIPTCLLCYLTVVCCGWRAFWHVIHRQLFVHLHHHQYTYTCLSFICIGMLWYGKTICFAIFKLLQNLPSLVGTDCVRFRTNPYYVFCMRYARVLLTRRVWIFSIVHDVEIR